MTGMLHQRILRNIRQNRYEFVSIKGRRFCKRLRERPFLGLPRCPEFLNWSQFRCRKMGQRACKPLPKIARKAGDPMNIFNLPSVHQEIVYPSHKRTQNFSVCRCWQSTKFPICDNSHKVLQKQGCNCGPAMLEIRQAPSVEEPRAFKSTAGTSKDNPSAGVLFGGAASVAAAVAAGGHALGYF